MAGSSKPDIGADEFNPPTCPPPASTSVDNLSSDSATIQWIANVSNNEVEVVVRRCDTTQGSPMVMYTTADSVSVSGLMPSTCYEYSLREICGAGDTSLLVGWYQFNTLIRGPVGVNCTSGGAATEIFTEEFDAIGSWTGDVNNGTTAGDWNFGFSGGTGSGSTGPSGAHSGSNYAYVEASGSAGNPWGTHAIMYSPPIDLTTGADEAELSFWMHAYGQTMGTLTVRVDTVLNGSYNTTLFSWSGELQTDELDPWQNVGIRLDNYVGDTVYLQFDFLIGNNFYSDFAIDLLQVSTCVSCAAVDSLGTDNARLSSVILNWEDPNNTNDFQVEYGGAGFSPGTGTLLSSTTDSLLLTGLTPDSTYEYYVRAICAVGDSSSWEGPAQFATASLGTISGSDTICAGDSTTLTTDGTCPTLQWQELVNNNWVDISGATTASIMVGPSTATTYRVLECDTNPSQNTFTVTPITLPAPTVNSGNPLPNCGDPGTDTLIATSSFTGAGFIWYDSAVGGNIISTSDTLYYTATPGNPSTPSIDTFYVETTTGASSDSANAHPFVGGNGCGGGNMFDIDPKIDLDIEGFALNMGVTQGLSSPVSVYIKSGTYDGSQTSSAAWTRVDTQTVTSAGPNNMTKVTLNTPIRVNANNITGIYIFFEADYTNVTTNTTYTNKDMDIIIGDGLCSLFGGVNTGRAWNGKVYYGGGCQSTRTMAIGEVNCVIGAEELANNFGRSISITPNPSDGRFRLNITKLKEQLNLEIRDIDGKLVYEDRLNVNGSMTEELDLTGLAKGVYFLKLQGEESSKVEKLIIQ
jgi:hypothetical protein